MVCGNFILPEPASYVFFYAFSNLRNLLYIIRGMEVLQMFRRKAEKRMVELSPDEARLLREALLAFRNKLLSAGKPTEDVNELIIKVMK